MRVEEYQQMLETMSEPELVELISDLNRNRQTVTEGRIKAVRKKAEKKSLDSALDSLSDEEKATLKAKLLAMK